MLCENINNEYKQQQHTILVCAAYVFSLQYRFLECFIPWYRAMYVGEISVCRGCFYYYSSSSVFRKLWIIFFKWLNDTWQSFQYGSFTINWIHLYSYIYNLDVLTYRKWKIPKMLRYWMWWHFWRKGKKMWAIHCELYIVGV